MHRRWWYLLPGVAVVFMAALHWHSAGGPEFSIDDAYITQHNARALLDGVDRNFAEATPLHGSTSAVHLALLTSFGVVLPLGTAHFVLCVLTALLYAFGLVRLARVAGAPEWAASSFALVALVLGETPHHLLNGLETSLAMAGITWLLVALASPRGTRLAAPLLAGTLPFIRPELAALSVLLLMASSSDVRTFATACVRAALAATPWALWYLVETGMPWPPTVEAKQLYFAEWCEPFARRWALFASPLLHFALVMGAALVGLMVLFRHWRGRAALAFTGLLLLAYLMKFPSSIDHYEHRYLYVLVPVMAWGVAEGLWKFRSRLMLVAALAITVHSAVLLPSRFGWHLDIVRSMQRETSGVTSWLKKNLQPDARVLVHDAGLVSIDSPFALVDLVGLKTPSSVAVHREAGTQVCGHGQQGIAAAVIAFQQRTDTFVVLHTWDRVFQLTDGLEAMGFEVTRLDTERGESAYRVYRLSPPSELRSR